MISTLPVRSHTTMIHVPSTVSKWHRQLDQFLHKKCLGWRFRQNLPHFRILWTKILKDGFLYRNYRILTFLCPKLPKSIPLPSLKWTKIAKQYTLSIPFWLDKKFEKVYPCGRHILRYLYQISNPRDSFSRLTASLTWYH